ncbi:MAG: hypothetical protein ACR2P8_07260 [Myxococcota bacterium]
MAVWKDRCSGRWRARLLLALAVLLWGAAPAAGQDEDGGELPAGEPPEMNTWYAQVMAHSPIGINVTHFWSKDGKLRAETVIAGRRIVTIVDEKTYYAYDLLVRTGIAVERSPVAIRQDAERRRPFGNEFFALQRQGAEPIGTAKLGGRDVELYQVTDDRGKRKIWVTPDERRLPLRIFAFQRGTGREMTTDYLNWQRGLPILNAFFIPEPGVDIAQLSYEEYVEKQAERVPLGPVPVLYSDLLHGY